MYRLRLAVTLAALAANVISGQAQTITCQYPKSFVCMSIDGTARLPVSAAIDVSCGGNAYGAGTCVARKNDGTAVAWGHAGYGGDAKSVVLTNVADISCGGYACVARKNDGTAEAWGQAGYGGDASSVDLTNVADISCSEKACVARKNDSTAVAWGSAYNGGDAKSVDLTNVADISCGGYACVARKNDGTAVAWGDARFGGNASSVDLTNVADISCGGQACVARKNDGTAVAWGDADYGGDAKSVDLTNVADISCGGKACVARKNDGTAVAWGGTRDGGDASSVTLTNVADISCGGGACVARKNDGTAVAWGSAYNGGDAKSVDLTNVADISCGGYACVARKNDGTAVAWGDARFGGNASSVDLTNVADISCGGQACVARKNDGTAVAWGDADYGGDAKSVDLTNVADISCGGKACVARKNDGTAVAWGGTRDGGDASSVTLTNVADISCGGGACVARKNDGTVEAWGPLSAGGWTLGACTELKISLRWARLPPTCATAECCTSNNNNGGGGGNNNNGGAHLDGGGNNDNGGGQIAETQRRAQLRIKCQAGGFCHTVCMNDGGDMVCRKEDKDTVIAKCSDEFHRYEYDYTEKNPRFRPYEYSRYKLLDGGKHCTLAKEGCPICTADLQNCIQNKVQFCKQVCMKTQPVPCKEFSEDGGYKGYTNGNICNPEKTEICKAEKRGCALRVGGGLLDCAKQVPGWLPYGQFDCKTVKGTCLAKKSCHPSDSIVNVKRSWGGIVAVTMANLKIGDVVESKHGTYEPIIAFSHRDYKHTAEFFQISAGNHTLDISDGHYMYLHDKETLVQPRDVQIGDRLSTGEIVSSIQKVRKIGLIHPHTWSSTLVVNGVQTSTNTEYIDLVVQDFVTTPLMYLAYLLRMPVDLFPGSRLWKSEQVAFNRYLQNMLRDVVPKVLHPFVAPFVAVPFVVAGLMHVFPEHVAVVCVLVFLNLASTKTVRSKLSKKQSMLSCGAMGFLVLSLLLHSANAACTDFTTEASVQDSSCQSCTGTACSSATCTPGYHTYGRDTETCQACTSMSNATAVTCTERWSSFIVACEEGFTRTSIEYEYKDNTTNTIVRGNSTACVLTAIIAEREALEKKWESSSNGDTSYSFDGVHLFFFVIAMIPIVFGCRYLHHYQKTKKKKKEAEETCNQGGETITVEVELQSNPMKK